MLDRQLLWEAYPRGYVALRGVMTVGGWLCLNTPGDGEPASFYHPKHGVITKGTLEIREHDTRFLEAGELLPDVDPSDTATWSCLKRELAETTWMMPGKRMEGTGRVKTEFVWVQERDSRWYIGAVSWRGADQEEGKCSSHSFQGIETDDPARALVRARARMKNEEEMAMSLERGIKNDQP